MLSLKFVTKVEAIVAAEIVMDWWQTGEGVQNLAWSELFANINRDLS